MNRVLFETSEVDGGGIAVCRDARADHMREVLKVKPGRTVKVGIINGPAGVGTVVAADPDSVVLRCDFESAPGPAPTVDLLLALPRPKVLKRLWAPIASLGVGRIILTNAEKVERNYFDTHWLDPAHYRPLLVEGLQQSGDTHLPEVTIARRLKPFVQDQLAGIFPGGLRIVADPSGEQRIASLIVPVEQRVLVAIGPEGGWTEFELDLLKSEGFTVVLIGSRILRTDTACIALLAMVQEALSQRPLVRMSER